MAGAEKHLITLLAGLRAEGFDARLLLWVTPTHQAEDVAAAAQENGIPLERWTMQHHLDPAFFLRLVRYLRREQPALVHTHLVHAETYAIPAARLAGVRVVVNSSHNDDPFRRRALFRVRSWALWRMTTRGIAISDHIQRFLVQVESARPQQIERIYYGLTPPPPTPFNLRQSLGLAADTRLVGSVCRLVPQKGISYALDALAGIHDPQLHYILIGDGDLRPQLAAQAAQLGIADRVHFLGWRADAPSLIPELDLFLAPSLWEGFGLVLLEAMAAARPIIASRIASIPEIVQDGTTGLLVPPQDADALKMAIQTLLKNPQQMQAMGAAGRHRLENHFNPQSMIDQTAALYRELLP